MASKMIREICQEIEDTVGGVNENNFIVLVSRILIDPIRVQNSQIGTLTAHTFLSCDT